MKRSAIARIASACRLGEMPQAADAVELAVALECWLSGSVLTLDEAFEVKRHRGERTNRTRTVFQLRDDLLLTCAQRHFGNLSRQRQAEEIERASERYTSGLWRIDRSKAAMPAAYVGTPREIFWQLLKAGSTVPRTRRLVSILNGTSTATKYPDYIAGSKPYMRRVG